MAYNRNSARRLSAIIHCFRFAKRQFAWLPRFLASGFLDRPTDRSKFEIPTENSRVKTGLASTEDETERL
jgi:hypothetical protein